jgi:signal transduction histidine kinase
MLDAAIAEEVREVDESDRLALEALRRSELVAMVAALIAVVVGAVTVLLVQRQVRRPLKRILEGTAALGRGDFTHRLPVTNGDELSQVAASFNSMAERVERGHGKLLTSRSRLEELVNARTDELRRANEVLTRADQVRRRFFADISHELRTPLTVIRGESEIALRGGEKSSEEYKVALDRVQAQASYLSQLVDDLLFIARAEAGAARLQRQTISLASLLRGVCRDGVVLGREADIEVQLREHVAESSLQGDPGKLRQLFLILIDNAVRYSRPGGLVTIDLSPAARGLSVRIADEGTGLPDDEVDTVFERLRQGSNVPIRNDGGSGLGLPLAKAIVEAHGGEIHVDSGLDRGTVVTIVLPAHTKLRAIA